MIKRKAADYIARIAAKFPVVSITGPRQSGKTTLARATFPDYEYLNLENPDTMHEAMADGASFFRNHPAPLILDEVQRMPELLSRIQVAVDESPRQKGMFVLTGSQQPRLKDGISQSLAGRVAIATLLPFSMDELAEADVVQTREAYMHNGFMPRLYNERLTPFDIYENYLATYVERDVNQIAHIKNRREFDVFLRVLAGRVGQLVNCQSIANDIGVSMPTVKSWISILEACFIITVLPCYYRNFGKRFVKAPKIYFTDVGLLTHLLGIREQAQIVRDPLFGAIFENMVVMEAFKAKLNRGLPPDLYFIRDRSGTEVDLVAEQGRKLHLFEIKASASYSADFTKNMDRLSNGIGAVASQSVIYSGRDLPNGKSAGYFNFANIARRMEKLSLF